MKKLIKLFSIICICFLFLGCEKKDSNKNRIIPANEKHNMQIWASGDEKILEAFGKEFLSENKVPGLTIDVVPFDSSIDLLNILVDEMAEGKGPDVIYTDGNWLAQNFKKLIPLPQDDLYNISKFRSTFVRAASDTVIQNQEIYGIPVGVDTLAIYYNEEHLIDHLPDRNQPAKVWAEFRQDTEKLSQSDNSFERFLVSGAAIGRVDNLNYGVEILENLMIQMGVKFFENNSQTALNKKGIDSKGNKKNFAEDAIQFFTSFADPRFKNFSWSEFLANPNSEYKDFETFVKGKVSMVFGYSRDYQKIKNLIKEKKSLSGLSEKNLRVAFFPQFQNPNQSNEKELIGKIRVLSVPKNSKYPKISWDFLKFVAKKDNIRSFHEATDLPTSRLDLISEQEAKPHIGIFVRQAKFARTHFLPIKMDLFKDGLSQLISDINSGKISIEQSLKNLSNKWNNVLKKKQQIEKIINS